MNAGVKMGINKWLEPLLALGVVAGVAHALYFLHQNHYLPQPFFYDPADSLMDWINTAQWAHDSGTYDVWATIYPPLSFIFLKFFSLARCYDDMQGSLSRDCDWWSITSLCGFFLVNIGLVGWSYYKIDRNTALPRTIALGVGLPALFGLERGNLVIVCFTFFVLAYGPILKSARWKWLCAAFAINFKIYLLPTILPQLLRRRWRWFEGALLATIAVYVLTWGLLGRGTPTNLIKNIQDFAGIYQAVNFLDLWYAGTYGPLHSLLDGSIFPIMLVAGSTNIEMMQFWTNFALHATQAIILIASLAAWVRPEVVPMFRLTNFATSFALITIEAGGYTQTLILFLALMERWKGIGRKWVILVCYVLCLPADITIFRFDPVVRESFLGGRPAVLEYAISYGPFLRPGLIMSIPFALACVTIHDVWQDIRRQGWKGRRRYRFDAPLFANGGRKIDSGKAPEPA